VKKVVKCNDYLPGKALNMGIRESKGEYIVCLSGHCIPVNDSWLSMLIAALTDKEVVGSYGRQEPMEFTSDPDKRDLALIFGLDRKIQMKDSFFHNANSAIRRDIWEKIPFDEKATNIEDRIWAKQVLEAGYKIVYEPEASVYHYHGIHQNGNEERCRSVVRILEDLHSNYQYKSIDIERLNIVALVPVRGQIRYLNDKPLLAYTIERARESKYIKKIIISTDDVKTAGLAKGLGAEAPFIRDRSFSAENVNMAQVLQHSLHKVEELGIFPDLVVSMEATFPFRPKGLLDNMILQLAQKGFDSVIAAKRENKAIWKEINGEIVELDEGLTPRRFKDPTFIELRGVGCVTHPEFLRQGQILGAKTGIYEIDNPYSQLEVRSPDDLKKASHLIKEWFSIL
jgi:CMP-N-acetylneuraminic acid synthetase